ncbi:hypothetical protein J6590_065438, partial [Homalodisca vitripennis]
MPGPLNSTLNLQYSSCNYQNVFNFSFKFCRERYFHAKSDCATLKETSKQQLIVGKTICKDRTVQRSSIVTTTFDVACLEPTRHAEKGHSAQPPLMYGMVVGRSKKLTKATERPLSNGA